MLHFVAITGKLPFRSLMHFFQARGSPHVSKSCVAGTVQNCKQAAETFTSRAYCSLKLKEKVILSFEGLSSCPVKVPELRLAQASFSEFGMTSANGSVAQPGHLHF